MPDWKSRATPVSDWKSRAKPVGNEEPDQFAGIDPDSIGGKVKLGVMALDDASRNVLNDIPVVGPAAIRATEAATGYFMGDKAQEQMHKENEKSYAEYERDHPVLSTGAKVAGGALLPAGPFAAAKGVLGAAGRVGYNAGASALDANLRGQDVGLATAIGAGGSALGEGVSALKTVPGALKNMAEARAVKAATGQNKRAISDMVKTGKISVEDGQMSSKLGRELLEADEAGKAVVGPLSRVDDIAPRARAKADFYGERIGEIGKQIDKTMPNAVDGKKIAQRILEEAAQIPDVASKKNIVDAMMREAQDFERMGSMSFQKAQELKNLYKFKPTDPTQVLSQDATNAIKRAIGQEMDDTASALSKAATGDAEKIPLKELLDKYQASKQKYGNYATAAEASEKKVADNLSNRFMSPSDYGTGGMAGMGYAMAHGGSPAAIGAALVGAGANKFARERGSALAARSADALAKLLENDPARFGKFRNILEEAYKKGNANLALTHYLLEQNDPEYRKVLSGEQ